MAEEVLARTEVAPLSSGDDAGRLLEAWRLGLGHCISIMRAPDYVAGEDVKRDRLMWEMTAGMGNQLLRIGEGLLQREKTDRLAGLLEQLRASEKKSAAKKK